MTESHERLELPWVEKYRPKTLNEMLGQEPIVQRLQSYAKTRTLPNMLFAGSAGIGKTSAAIALARELFGEGYERNFLELNASNDRGIDVVRNTIKEFARTLAFNADYKIIFLDEADALTTDAQQALRRTMELYTKTTRFILSCVTPDTKIMLPEETEITIGDYFTDYESGQQKRVLNVNEKNGTTKNDLVLCAIKQNPKTTGKKAYEITTNTGRKLKLTHDHPLLTESGWKEAGGISMGERIVIFPTLETTEWPIDPRPLFDVNEFKQYLTQYEIENGYHPIERGKKFIELATQEKMKIAERVKELHQFILSGNGLTIRESELLKKIHPITPISRKELQNQMGLSRIRTGQLLHSLEKKGFAERTRKGKTHLFISTHKNGKQLRNIMDIKRLINHEFGITISWEEIKKIPTTKITHSGRYAHTLIELERKGLLSLQCDSEKTFPLTRILGFIYGDGHIIHSRQRIIFTGNPKALEEVRKDLTGIGFTASPLHSKKVSSTLGGRAFEGTTHWIHVDSRPLANLLCFLGATVGDKIITPYAIPAIIKNGNKLMKREFLRALYGCEGYSPKIKKNNFEAITLRMHKDFTLRKNMLAFFEDLRQLLNEFEVESYITISKLNYVRKDGKIPECYSLILKSNNQNLFKFLSRIGYAFEQEKVNKARLGAEYLRHKQEHLQTQKNKVPIILEALSAGKKTKTQIAREVNCSPDFIRNQLRNTEVHVPRDFPPFEKWKLKYHYKEGLVYNEVVSLKEIDADSVIDLTCLDDHNFIANGFVSHNCNYSSKLIEPIQSRCVVFRFKPLSGTYIQKRVQEIANAEGLEVTSGALNAIEYVSEGDLRKAINVLQASGTLDKKIDEKTVYTVSSRAQPKEIKELIQLALAQKFLEARTKIDALLYEYGMSGEDIILQLYREIVNAPENEINSKTKIDLIERVGEANFRIVEGANERIQLEALVAQIMKHAHEKA